MIKKPVIGYEYGYEADPDGNIYRLPHTFTDKNGRMIHRKYQKLKQMTTKDGYLCVTLYDQEGNGRKIFVHKIIAELFVPNPNNYYIVRFKDNDKSHCQADNLKWEKLIQSGVDTRTKLLGEDHGNAKITNELAREIKQNGKYDTYTNMARDYGVSKAILSQILTGRTWKHIKIDDVN